MVCVSLTLVELGGRGEWPAYTYTYHIHIHPCLYTYSSVSPSRLVDTLEKIPGVTILTVKP